MNTGMLDVLHDAADHHRFIVAYRIHVDLGRAAQIPIDEQWMPLGGFESLCDVPAQRGLVTNYLHRPAAENIRGTDQDRIADLLGTADCLGQSAYQNPARLLELKLFAQ